MVWPTEFLLISSVLEIQNFLSNDECDLIISMANATGMATSQTVWQEYKDVLEEGSLYPIFKRLDVNDDDGLDYFEVSKKQNIFLQTFLVVVRGKYHLSTLRRSQLLTSAICKNY